MESTEIDASRISLKSIKCWQINLHRSFGTTDSFNRRLNSSKHFIALIQEPHCIKNSIKGFNPNYNIYAGSSTVRPRAAIVLPKHLNSSVLPLAEFSDRDLSVIIINNHSSTSRNLVLASMYLHGSDSIPSTKMEALVNYCIDKDLPLVVGGDANAHHTLWGSTNINDRGLELMDYLRANSLPWCNVGNTPTFVTKTREEVLDITFTNLKADGVVSDWKVSCDSSISDHSIINFSLIYKRSITFKYRNVKNTNWDEYKEKLKSSHAPSHCNLFNISTDSLNSEVSRVTADIFKAYGSSCPHTFTKFAHSSPWWNDELTDSRKSVRAAHKRARRSRLPSDWVTYRAGLKAYNKLIRKAKKSSWRDFCSSTSSISSAAKLSRILRKSKSKPISNLLKTDGSYTKSQEETLETLINTLVDSRPVVRGGIGFC